MSENGESKAIIPRDEKGRFLKGKPPGPGRKPVAVEEKYYLATVGSVSLDDWIAVVDKALEKAKKGDRYAREWLGNYILGRPKQRIDDDILDRVIQVVYVDNWRENPTD